MELDRQQEIDLQKRFIKQHGITKIETGRKTIQNWQGLERKLWKQRQEREKQTERRKQKNAPVSYQYNSKEPTKAFSITLPISCVEKLSEIATEYRTTAHKILRHFILKDMTKRGLLNEKIINLNQHP